MRKNGHYPMVFTLLALLLFASEAFSQQRGDIILFDIEQGILRDWELTGKNFLATGAPIHRDTVVSWERGPVGFSGMYYLETGHDRGRHFNKQGGGALLSPSFRISRNFLNFYLAGQLNPGVRVFLEVGGEIVREAFGNNFYDLILRGWDVREFDGMLGRFGVEDRSHYRSLIRLDHVYLSDNAPPGPEDWVKQEDRQRSSIVSPGEFICIFDNRQITDGNWVVERATIVHGPDNQWHMYAMVLEASNVWDPRKPGKIIHATSSELLNGWTYNRIALQADPAYGEQFLLDPFVLVHNGMFYMFYVGAGNLWSGWYKGPEGNTNPWHLGASGDYGPNSMFLATSANGKDWRRAGLADEKRPGKIFTEKPFGLAPFVHFMDSVWVMYYASTLDETVYSKHAIGYRISQDLVTWSNRKHALIDWSYDDQEEAAHFFPNQPASPWPEHSFFSNPAVFRRGDVWHLWAGPIDNNNLSRYHCLRIYTSNSPFRFRGHWEAKEVNKRVFVDGGGHPFQDAAGNWYIFHTNSMSGGVWIAPLFWND